MKRPVVSTPCVGHFQGHRISEKKLTIWNNFTSDPFLSGEREAGDALREPKPKTFRPI